MPRTVRVGVHLFAAYLTLEIVAGYGFDKQHGQPSGTWTAIGLVSAATVFLALELYARRRATGRWIGRSRGRGGRSRSASGRRPA